MMSLQEMSDRLEIQDLLARYSYAIDDHDWDLLDQVFTPDAQIDYSAAGGAKGSYPEIRAWFPDALNKQRLPTYQHMVATTKLDISGDTARSRTILFNPMVYRSDAGEEQVFFIGLWYRDALVRTAGGWRISERVEEMSYAYNMPEMSPAVEMSRGEPAGSAG